MIVSELPDMGQVANPCFLPKMNTIEVKLSQQARVAVDHDPPVQVSGNLFQVFGNLPVGLSRLSKMESGRRLLQDPDNHLRFIATIGRRRDDDQVHGYSIP